MPDRLSPTQRSEQMRRIRKTDTGPELIVRKTVHALGFRYRLHRRDLPGCPDLVFPKTRRVLFVHGCFWHQHKGCPLARLPKSRQEYWIPKLIGNRRRDVVNREHLEAMGWSVSVIWECETKDSVRLERRLRDFLE